MPTERHFESLAERQIREAMDRGEFDDLPGAGKPIEGLGPVYDPAWWAKGYILRERARDRADEVRGALRAELPRLKAMDDAGAAHGRVLELQAMVDAVNEHLPDADHIPPVEL